MKETQKGVVVFTNSTEGADDIGFKLLNPDAMLNPVKASIVPTFRKILDSLGADAAIAHYGEVRAEQEDEYDFSEGVLNALGYAYMETNLPAALVVFKLNVEQYPASHHAYDSYGKALLKSGDQALAIESYKKSLAINPANRNALAELEKLGVKWEEPMVNVPEETLEAYTGTYELTKWLKITITRQGNQLYGQATGNPKTELFPKSQDEFYLKVVDAQVTFDKNEEAITVHQNGQVMKGKKID